MATGQSRVDAVQRIEREVLVLLHRVRRTAAENARLVHPDLQPAAYTVLRFVEEHEPTRAADIVEQLGTDKGAVSRQVAILEQLGLVERRSDEADRRAQTLVLTGEARARVTALRGQLRARFTDRLSTWSVNDLAGFAGDLARYNDSLA